MSLGKTTIRNNEIRNNAPVPWRITSWLTTLARGQTLPGMPVSVHTLHSMWFWNNLSRRTPGRRKSSVRILWLWEKTPSSTTAEHWPRSISARIPRVSSRTFTIWSQRPSWTWWSTPTPSRIGCRTSCTGFIHAIFKKSNHFSNKDF